MRSFISTAAGSALFAVTLFFLSPLAADDAASAGDHDWPAWRGQARLGEWSETGIIGEFPEGGPEVAWRVPIKGGYGGPAVAGGRIFATDFEPEPKSYDGTERLLCLSEETGELLWEHSWRVNTKGTQKKYANGPRATPTVDGNLVFIQGSMGHLIALNISDGTVAWSHDLVAEYGTLIPIWGMAGSPLVDGEKLIVVVGGDPGAKVMAFDKTTGKEIWRSLDADAGPGYSSPVIVEAGGARQLIVWHPAGVDSLNPETGKPYWAIPTPTSMGQSVMTPVLAGNNLIVSGSANGTTLIALGTSEPTAELVRQDPNRAKRDEGLYAFMSTPMVDGDYMYGIDYNGSLRCVNHVTNELMWTTFEPSEDASLATAFIVKNGDRYFINNDRGELIIADLSPEGYEEISRTQLLKADNPNFAGGRRELGMVNWVHPAYANGHIVHRNDREIIRVKLKRD